MAPAENHGRRHEQMSGPTHEIRDPIHTFVRLSSGERDLLSLLPFQRLKYIHQLGMSFQVYPGATHTRFEHSLGVVELASRVFSLITSPNRLRPEAKNLLPELHDDACHYWHQVVRLAALCHDIGHLPFSHAAEFELLPHGWTHERLTRAIIDTPMVSDALASLTPPLRKDDVIRIAVGPTHAPDLAFSPWHRLLSEVITGDALGVDRMDYLLRDSHHLGVPYGRFDHYHLIDSLRILVLPDAPSTPTLGVTEGGLKSAEALLIARHFMYHQVYYHAIRRIYDIHLQDFLKEWLPSGRFAITPSELLSVTDNDVASAFLHASQNVRASGHVHAKRLSFHDHFPVLCSASTPESIASFGARESAVREHFGDDAVRSFVSSEDISSIAFPILLKSESVVPLTLVSSVLTHLPPIDIRILYIRRDLREEAQQWLANEFRGIS
jgi:uncharacterized protein